MKKKSIALLASLGVLLLLSLLFGSLFLDQVSTDEFLGIQPLNCQSAVSKQEIQIPSAGLRADAYMLQGNYRKVVALLTGKQLNPHTATLLIKAELAIGENSKALALINQFRSSVEVVRLESLYLANSGYYISAREYLSAYPEQGQGVQPEAELYLCQILLKQGQWEECNSLLQRLQSSRPEVLLLKGDLALARSDFEQAWQAYTSVMDMRYYTEDINLLAKATIAALGANKDWETMLKRLREQDDHSGLPDYVAAQADL
ncbi:MAG TPA: hypothetical protein VFF14_08205, partial [Candidatus Deferrimicrobium sp.]|nr:hypothetical protein [Candidatus Deferrimicrobium sp.]